MKHLIDAKNLTKSYPSQMEVLKHCDISIMEKEFVVIMGPSGSGKSTLLLALGAMEPVDSGEILFDNKDISKLSEKQAASLRRHDMGFVFQQPTLLKHLNILDNIIYPHLSKSNKQKLVNNAKELMKKVGIEGLEHRFMNEVSGGQLQRACICRAVLNKPKIVFADEPTGALNSLASMEIMKIFKDLNDEGIALCIVTHDSNVASFGDRVLLMKDGIIETQLTFSDEDQSTKLELIKEKMNEYGI